MEEWRRKRIEEVYARWEKRGRGGPTVNNSGVVRQSPGGRPPRYPNGSVSSRFNRRSRQKIESAVVPLPAFVPSLGVDTNALHAANRNKYTSITRCCQQCAPASRTKYYSDESPGTGLRDLLVIDKRQHPGILGRLFPYLTHVLCAKMDYSMGDLRKDTLNSKRVTEAIDICAKAKAENDPTRYERELKEQQQRAQSIVYKMSSGVYGSLTRFVAWVLFWVFRRLFNQVCVQKKHIHMLKEAQKRGVPIVFLPSHKSHMDYIIMTFILFNLGIHVPRIAAGDNLQLPVVSWMVSHLGGFFIKRKLDSAAGKDVLYRKILHEYMERCLIAGENMEFFIEGSRSRSGKTTSPKAGLLSVLMDTVREGVVEDILVVPVNISYDKLLEKSFVTHELMGGSKKAETFRDSLRGAWFMLSTDIGSVRIDFAQPFSMQEYLMSACISSSSLLEVSNLSRSRSMVNLVGHDHRRLVTAASHHIVYDISQSATLMSTSMVSFLLLNKFRQGVSVPGLIEGYSWLEGKARTKGRAVSYTGEPSEAVHYALHYLSGLVEVEDKQNQGVPTTDGFMKEGLIVRPRLDLPGVFELLHHSNQVAPLLVLEGVVASSVLRVVGEELRNSVTNSPLEVDREEVIEDAQFLCQLLAREFIFAPPCVDLWSVLNDTLESFIVSELLKVPKSGQRSTGGQRLPRPLDYSDEDDDEVLTGIMLELNTDAECVKYLTFLGKILDPFIEAYWLTCVGLCQEDEGKDIQEGDFLKQLQKKMIDKNSRGVLASVESCSMDTLRNSVKSLIDMKLVAYSNASQVFHVEDSDKLIDLTETLVYFKS